VAKACRAIEDAEAGTTGVKLGELAAKAGLTKSHFHRVFKKVTGVTPRIYAVNVRAEKLLGVEPVVSTPELESGNSPAGGSDGVLTPGAPYLRSGHSAGEEPVTAELQALPFDADYEQAVGCMDSGMVGSTMQNHAFTKKVEYTIQPWASGLVLIAVSKDGICWLEAGNSVAELRLSLAHEFPLADLEMSGWSTNADFGKLESGKHRMFATVMEALVQPTGKVLDVQFDIS
jgi:AraC family transcriptional regulator, regulatory protein of adaptative response / methylated-DNA-[protein]-cysteine methyltransferase